MYTILIGILGVFFAFESNAREPVRILITSYEGFGLGKVLGSDENLSHDVALKLKSLVSENNLKIAVEVCRLPVTYDRAAEVALECFKRANPKPELVLSLGEGPRCHLLFETAAT